MKAEISTGRPAWWRILPLLLITCALGLWMPLQAGREANLQPEQSRSLSATEFTRTIKELSEAGGFFRSDNFTSNETSYLHIVGKLHELRVSGGAYIGVGPEQNFTYIARIKPQIAFIVDIRRQAMIQHLMYKALFEISENRGEFLANLTSRPLTGANAPDGAAPLGRLLDYFSSRPPADDVFAANLGRLREIILHRFRFELSGTDQEQLEYVYSAFLKDGLDIRFRFGNANWFGGYYNFPRLKDLILQTDLDGKTGNFLCTEEDYRFVRDLHNKNRIIPIVGDFAGPKALAAVGRYLRKNRYTVRAFYTSNVEYFLFQNQVFDSFVRNVRQLPIDSRSVFIRAVAARNQPHPAQNPGHRTITLLEKISVFLQDYDDGAYANYRDLISTHFIAGP